MEIYIGGDLSPELDKKIITRLGWSVAGLEAIKNAGARFGFADGDLSLVELAVKSETRLEVLEVPEVNFDDYIEGLDLTSEPYRIPFDLSGLAETSEGSGSADMIYYVIYSDVVPEDSIVRYSFSTEGFPIRKWHLDLTSIGIKSRSQRLTSETFLRYLPIVPNKKLSYNPGLHIDNFLIFGVEKSGQSIGIYMLILAPKLNGKLTLTAHLAYFATASQEISFVLKEAAATAKRLGAKILTGYDIIDPVSVRSLKGLISKNIEYLQFYNYTGAAEREDLEGLVLF